MIRSGEKMMNLSKNFTLACIAGVFMFGLSACQKNQQPVAEKGPAEQAGQQLDEAAAKAAEGLNKVAEKAGEGIKKAGESLQSTAKDAQSKSADSTPQK
jgi:hypothetical protein